MYYPSIKRSSDGYISRVTTTSDIPDLSAEISFTVTGFAENYNEFVFQAEPRASFPGIGDHPSMSEWDWLQTLFADDQPDHADDH